MEDMVDDFIINFCYLLVSSNNGKKVLHTMSLLLSPILEKSPGISFELLDVILRNILDKKKPAYQLAKHVLVMTLDHIEGCIGDVSFVKMFTKYIIRLCNYSYNL